MPILEPILHDVELLLPCRNSDDASLTEDFADVLLLKLFDVCVSSATDNDKVRGNVMRALGNFLAYLPERCFSASLCLVVLCLYFVLIL